MNPNNNITDDVMATLKRGDVKIKSKNYYLMLAIAWFVAAFLLIFIAALVVALFSYDDDAGDKLRGYGHELGSSSGSLFIVMIILIASVVGASYLLKRVKTVYRYQTGAVLAVLLLFIGLLSLGVWKVGVAEVASNHSMAKPITPHLKTVGEEHMVGNISSVDKDGFVLKLESGQVIRVKTSSSTRYRPSEPLETYDVVIVHTMPASHHVETDLVFINPPNEHLELVNSSY